MSDFDAEAWNEWMESPKAAQRCPRCDANPTYTCPEDWGTVSRTTRDDGAEIYVCRTCGESEVRRIFLGLPTIEFTDWPLSVNDLLLEERARIAFMRGSTFERVSFDAVTVEDRETPDEPETPQMPEARDELGWVATIDDAREALGDVFDALDHLRDALNELDFAYPDPEAHAKALRRVTGSVDEVYNDLNGAKATIQALPTNPLPGESDDDSPVDGVAS